MSNTALLIVGIEPAGSPGAWTIEGAEGILPVLQCYVERFRDGRVPVFAFRDQPEHRVMNCAEVDMPAQRGRGQPTASLWLPRDAVVVSGKLQGRGSSAFVACSPHGVSLGGLLGRRSIRRLCLAGARTEHVVWATALDACRQGFEVVLLLDAVHGGECSNEAARALDEMLRAQARTATLATLGTLVPEAVPRLSDSALRRILGDLEDFEDLGRRGPLE